ncbi:MAG TPA: type I 3-dehydroquinate dehydratase, partial [Pyrinomonadaceae bacterium]
METNSVRVCVPVCVQRASDLAAAIERATEVADIIEVRLDCLAENEREMTTSSLPGCLNSAGTPTILTLRSAEQGGYTSANHEARRRFWSSLHNLPGNCLIDLELDLVLDF